MQLNQTEYIAQRFAVADGVVVDTKDGVPDNIPTCAVKIKRQSLGIRG
jgi:hypothetical protein